MERCWETRMETRTAQEPPKNRTGTGPIIQSEARF